MSLVTSGVIGFANTTPTKLIEALREYETATESQIVDYYKLTNLVESVNGTKGPTYTIIGGGFNYWPPREIHKLCKWLWKNKHITSIGALSYEHTDGEVHVIKYDCWIDIE